jgi:hypothetical protein
MALLGAGRIWALMPTLRYRRDARCYYIYSGSVVLDQLHGKDFFLVRQRSIQTAAAAGVS